MGGNTALEQKSRSGIAAKAVRQKQTCDVVRISGGMSAWEQRKREQAGHVARRVCAPIDPLPFHFPFSLLPLLPSRPPFFSFHFRLFTFVPFVFCTIAFLHFLSWDFRDMFCATLLFFCV